MILDKQTHIANQIVRKRQTIHNGASLLGAKLGMTVKVAAARMVDRKAIGLGDVMQKRRPHKARRRLHAVTQRQLPRHRQHASNMLIDIKGMVDAALVKPTSRRKFGHGDTNKLGIAQHRVSPVTGRKNAFELNAHALACHGIEQR